MDSIPGCEKFNFDNAFHLRMFRYSGSITFNLASLIFFIQRQKIGLSKCYEYELQDESNLSKRRRKTYLIKFIFRLAIFNVLFALYYFLRSSLVEREKAPGPDIGYQLGLLMWQVFMPAVIIAYLLNCGFYDGGVQFLGYLFRIQ